MKARAAAIRRTILTRKTLRVGTATLALLLALGMPAWGQASTGNTGLPAEVAEQLQGLDWSEEDVLEFAAQDADWSAFRARDAKMLALSLDYARGQSEGLGPAVQAQLALQMCRAMREMESLGYGEIGMARAVFAGVRASVQEIVAWRAGGGEGEPGQRIRNSFRQELRVQAAAQAKAQARERVRVQRGTGGGGPVPAPGPGPASRPGKS